LSETLSSSASGADDGLFSVTVVNDPDDRSTAHPLKRLPTMSLEQSVDRNLGVFQETVKGFLIRLAVHLLRKTLARV
jgi:hypothetical protein